MERKINNDAWNILSPDEKTSLSLSLAFNKSTWEAGEVMKKAHFKYLEIQKRARKYLEIFTNHFEKYGGLFPEDVLISFAFKEYLTLTILERKPISKATKFMEDSSYSIASRRNKLIIKELEKLSRSDRESHKDLYSLIMDFDRWNNFRILPIEIQEPSAFKRRNKVRNVKHLRNLTNLPQFSVLKLIENFGYSGKYPKLYLPIISSYISNGHKVIAIKDSKTNINDITRIGIFLFKTRAKAEEFALLVSDYFTGETRNCRDGQKFWPLFRVLMYEAINYKEIENIHKSRTFLDKAIHDLDHTMTKNKSKHISTGETPVEDPNFFYQ
jgi:hypothetical protein